MTVDVGRDALVVAMEHLALLERHPSGREPEEQEQLLFELFSLKLMSSPRGRVVETQAFHSSQCEFEPSQLRHFIRALAPRT